MRIILRGYVMGRTIIEFFSEEALENVMVMLSYQPEHIIYIGHKHNMITKKIRSLTAFAKRVSPDTELEFIEVSRDDIDEIINLLNSLCDKYPDCEFELSGGGELILMALGCVSAMRNINTIRIDPYTNMEIITRNGKATRDYKNAKATVSEIITLHGGRLTTREGILADGTVYSGEWHFTPDFRNDIRTLWAICSKLKTKWNRYCAVIEEVIKNNPSDETGRFILPLSQLGDSAVIFRELNKKELLYDYSTTPKTVSFSFKNNMIKKIITKTGNILELHVYEVATRHPSMFHNAVIGASIDWDGVVHDYENPGYDTVNEIDVILMRDVVPTFISCKSGRAGSNALHELQTVTSRFGGKYAKKALVMSCSCDTTTGANFFRQRSKDMHIWVIDNVFEMTDDELLAKLKRIQGP